MNRELENSTKTRSAALTRAAAVGAAALIMGGLLVGCGESSADQDSGPSQSESNSSPSGTPTSETASSTPSPTTSPTRVSNPDHDNLDPRGPLPGSTKWEQMTEDER